MPLSSKNTFQNIFSFGEWKGLDEFFDVTLRTDDGCVFKVHRIILARRSEFFCALFTHEKGEEICIKDIETNTLEKILIYIYTGKDHLEENNLWNILIAADYFLLDDLLNKSISFANKSVSQKSCLLALTIASRIQKLKMIKYIYRYVIVHFEELHNTQDIGILPLPILKMILKEDNLNVTSEETVYKTVINWVEVNRDERLKYVGELLNFLRWKEMNDDLASEIINSDYVKNNSFFSNQSQKAITNYFTSGNDTLCISQQRQPKHLHFILGDSMSPTNFKRAIYVSYDHEIDYWRCVCNLHLELFSVVRTGHILYLFDTVNNEGVTFDILHETLAPISSPNRSGFEMITVGDCIWAVGGSDDEGVGNHMEFYDPVLNAWSSIRLSHAMEIQAAVALNCCIYLIGSDESERLVCQVYNTVTGSWFIASPPIYHRSVMYAASFKGKVYLSGGDLPSQVEEYDPQLNAWKVLPPVPFKFNLYNDRLLAVGSLVDENFAICHNSGTSPPVYWDGQEWRNVENCHEWKRLPSIYPLCTVDDSGLIEELTRRNRRKGTQWHHISYIVSTWR